MSGAAARLRRRLARVSDALDGVAAVAGEVVAALPEAPAGRDAPALERALAALPHRCDRLAESAAWLRRQPEGPEAETAIAAAKVTLKSQAPVERGLATVLKAESWPLLDHPEADWRSRRKIELLSRGFAELEKGVAGRVQAEEMKDYGYPFIPVDPGLFVALLQAAWRILTVEGRTEGARYLEVGCGAGTKLPLAAAFFTEVEGLELDPIYLAKARAHWPAHAIHGADALVFDGYGAYAVIYAYVPIRDVEIQGRFERHLMASAAPGTVILAPMEKRTHLQSLPKLAPGVFVAGRDESAVHALRLEAERVGPVVPPPRRRRVPAARLDRLRPAIAALDRAGFAP